MMHPPARFAIVATLLLVGGCVGNPAPPRAAAPPVAPPRSRAAPPPQRPVNKGADWRDWAVTPGTWTYRVDSRGSLALFGPRGEDALLSLRCDRQVRTVYLSRQGQASAPLTVRTSSLTRSLKVQPTGAAPFYGAAALQARDAILDAMAFSRGRFLVEQAGMPTLVVPAWAEIGRITEDCRG